MIHALSMGGAETLVKEYALRIDRRKFDLRILCLNHSDSPYEEVLAEAGIPIIYICDNVPFYESKNLFHRGFRRLFFSKHFYMKMVSSYIHDWNPDIIHVHLLMNEYVRYAKPDLGTRIFYTQHFSVDKYVKKHQNEIDSLKWIIRNYDTTIISLQNEMRLQLNSVLGIKDTIVLNNGIDISRFQSGKTKLSIRSELGIDQDAFVVGFVGRLTDVKNPLFLVDVFYEIHKLNASSILIIIGKGAMEDEVKSYIKKLGLMPNVIMLSNRTDVYDLLHTMDVFVMTSVSEGLPIVAIEAQVAGVRCVLSDVISSEVVISNLVSFISLDDGVLEWSKKITNEKIENAEYYGLYKWDINNVVRNLEKLYLNEKNTYSI